MTQAFLNHKTEEKNMVLFVKDYLTRCLIKAWLDADDMHGGSNLNRSILEGINISRYFIAFISQRYIRSNWCMQELEEAERLARDGKAIIIPVLLDARDELRLNDLDRARAIFLDSILARYVYIQYNRYDQEQSASEIASAIGRHEKIQFAPIVSKTVEGIELQLIQFQITAPGGNLPTDILRGLDLNIEGDFLGEHEGDRKPLRKRKPVAFSGQGPAWLYAYLAIQLKNLCPVYVFNNRSNEYICVYDSGTPPRQLGSVLKGT